MSERMPPRDPGHVVIVGGGLAGYSAAGALRDLGHTGSISVVEAEPAMYDRPPLSKGLFADGFGLDRLAFADADALAAKDIRVTPDRRAVALDADRLRLVLDDGQEIAGDTVLIATGARARRLPIPGAELPQVHTLRSFRDAEVLREALRPGVRVVLVGAGLIGAELASSLVAAGAAVVLVDPASVPLAPVLGEVMASCLHGMHAEHGVRVRTGTAARIDQSGDQLEVVMDDGSRLLADLVVVAVGAVPDTELAEAAGLDVDGGVLVDAEHRTSHAGIYAAGDVARRRNLDGTLERREEHWEAAQLSGRRAAAAMLGLEPPPRGASWFWSDRFGVHLEAVGRLSGRGEIVVRRVGAWPSVFLLDGGLLLGAASVDDPNVVRAARRIIDQRIPVTAAELEDPAVSLRELVKAAR